MKIRSKTIVTVAAWLSLSANLCAAAQEPAVLPPRKGTTPIEELVATVAKKSGKKFLIDPRVRADVLLIGDDAANVDYGALVTILSVHGLAAVEGSQYVHVLPEANARQLPLPMTGTGTHPDGQLVTSIIFVKSHWAASLVPVLRPLIPQFGHLVAFPCVNAMLLVDTFANVRRIEKIMQSIDHGEPYVLPKCGPREEMQRPGA
jgi:general secretion pathway protein D